MISRSLTRVVLDEAGEEAHGQHVKAVLEHIGPRGGLVVVEKRAVRGIEKDFLGRRVG